MLESLIRLSEAHARLYMKSEATVFDAISVIVLMEHTLMSCLFGLEPTPSVLFRNEEDYCEIRDLVLSRLELDPIQVNQTAFKSPCRGRASGNNDTDYARRRETPSPIRRIENNNVLFFNGNGNPHTSATQQ